VNRFSWQDAGSLFEAVQAADTTVARSMSKPLSPQGLGTVIKAGGIDVLDLMKGELLAPATLVGVARIGELGGIGVQPDGGLRIGATVTLAAVANHPTVKSQYAALADAAISTASPQIRNVATVGGNLLQRPRCWYFRSSAYDCLRKGGDQCFAMDGDNRNHAVLNNQPCAIVHPSSILTVLAALGAALDVVRANGAQDRVSAEEFFTVPQGDFTRENLLEPHELLASVHLPKLARETHCVYLRTSDKAAFDWPHAEVAVCLTRTSDGRCRSAGIVLGAAAPAPYRARAAEAMLLNRPVDEDIAAAAARAAIENATPLAGNAYKLPLLEALVRRAILAAARR
jgi:xanthine dehydrogenase YagS FAD-binding subunit